VFRNGQPAPVDGNLTDAFTEEALQFIERNRAEPFFLYLAYNAPHTPLQAEPSRLERFPATLTRDQRILNAMVAAMDDGVGRISARLRELGIDRNTLVVFVSDNGCPIYLGGACSNAGYAGGKRHLLEGGIRVPFIVRHPAALAPGTYARPVSTLDIAATAVAAAGADDAGLDGVDLRPFLAGRRGDPHRTLFWRLEPGLAVRSGDWKLIKAPRADGKAQETFLFNLAADPQERRNLAAAQPAVVVATGARLRPVGGPAASRDRPSPHRGPARRGGSCDLRLLRRCAPASPQPC
jgi:arylsulfatase A-like enzyme